MKEERESSHTELGRVETITSISKTLSNMRVNFRRIDISIPQPPSKHTNGLLQPPISENHPNKLKSKKQPFPQTTSHLDWKDGHAH